jgi:hypothetical protein
MRMWTGIIWLKVETSGLGCCEHVDENWNYNMSRAKMLLMKNATFFDHSDLHFDLFTFIPRKTCSVTSNFVSYLR